MSESVFDQSGQEIHGHQTNIAGDIYANQVNIAGSVHSYSGPAQDSGGIRRVRIFVASPGDVQAERERLQKIIQQMNRSTARRLNLVLDLIRWETHSIPDMGRPQQVILEQLTKFDWDIFIGILWLRFGTPSGAANNETGEDFESGTEEEFTFARSLRKVNENGWPKIMMYRCGRPPAEMFSFDAQQSLKVADFFNEFRADGAHPGLVCHYMSVNDFEDTIREHLDNVLWELGN